MSDLQALPTDEGVSAEVEVSLTAERDDEGVITVWAQLEDSNIVLTMGADADYNLAEAFIQAFPQVAQQGLQQLLASQEEVE